MPNTGKVTVRVYDFAMDEVKTIAENTQRGAGQWEEQWDARRSDGKSVATGVYYYSVEREGASTVWGKVAVIY
jgi:flagellar hook assembly protein FlgD